MAFNVINTQPHCPTETRDYLERNDCKVLDIHLEMLAEDQICAAVPGVDAVIAGGEHWTERVFQVADRLKIVARAGAGYDQVDLAAATRHRVWVTNTPGAPGPAVADFTLGLMLCLLRKIPTMAQDLKAGKWQPLFGREMSGLTLGVVGVGNIGCEVIKRVRGGFGSKVLGYDVVTNTDFAKQWQLEYVPLDELLAHSDIVLLAVPLTPQTKGLIDRRKLRMMKKDAYLINIARPAVVVKEDLIESLKAGEIAGAAIDVHDPKPCPLGDPLATLPNVLPTPWAASHTEEASLRMCMGAATEVVTVLKGGNPRFPLNRIDRG